MTRPVAGSRSRLLQAVVAVLVLVIGIVVWLITSNRDGGTPSNGGGQAAATSQASSSMTGTPRGRTTPPRTSAARATTTVDPDSGLRWIDASTLPPEGRATLTLISAGGPYPFPRNDDRPYYNNNRVLPQHPGGWYREYTVRTPGVSSRGARRIVEGDDGALFWTADHYDSFLRIRENG